MPTLSHSPRDVTDAFEFIQEAVALIEAGQGGYQVVQIIAASLETIWVAAERNVGVRAAAIDIFEVARALAAANAPSDVVRLHRLLRQALVKLHERVNAMALIRCNECPTAKAA